MAGEKAKKGKIRNIEGNRIRRIKREIKRCEGKMLKLLKLHEEGKKRWKFVDGEKVELNKTQGLIDGCKRHEALHTHIKFLKGKV